MGRDGSRDGGDTGDTMTAVKQTRGEQRDMRATSERKCDMEVVKTLQRIRAELCKKNQDP